MVAGAGCCAAYLLLHGAVGEWAGAGRWQTLRFLWPSAAFQQLYVSLVVGRGPTLGASVTMWIGTCHLSSCRSPPKWHLLGYPRQGHRMAMLENRFILEVNENDLWACISHALQSWPLQYIFWVYKVELNAPWNTCKVLYRTKLWRSAMADEDKWYTRYSNHNLQDNSTLWNSLAQSVKQNKSKCFS